MSKSFGGGGAFKTIYLNLFYVLCIGIIFFICRQINLHAHVLSLDDDLAHVVYFPSGIRLLAVMLFGWLGIVGILIGWIFCYVFAHEKTLLECILLGLLSGFTAYFSYQVWRYFYQIDKTLLEITGKQLFALVFISSGISAFVRFLYIYTQDQDTSFVSIFSVGLVGDILGALFSLYLIKLILYCFRNIVGEREF